MNDKMIDKNPLPGVELQRLVGVLLRKIWYIGIAAVAGAALVLLNVIFFVEPQYNSTAMFYVNNSNLTVGNTALRISYGDLYTSRFLVDSYIVILDTRETLEAVIDYAGVDCTYEELSGMIVASDVNETEMFKVTVTSGDPLEAEQLANAITHILPDRINNLINDTSARVVSAARVPKSQSTPSYTISLFVGFAVGMIIAVGVITVQEIYNITICEEEDITSVCQYPILASIPQMGTVPRNGKVSGKSGKQKKKQSGKSGQLHIIGPDISFAAAEAYKLLRAKLQFSFTDARRCHIIGVSSAFSGEGKSLTAVNLAYTMAQLDKKVLLVDCDMRRPTLADKLGLHRQPGLSNYLTRHCQLEDLVQMCDLKEEENGFHVITAGVHPPNPIELLCSERMKNVLHQISEGYDYVILDLPPVGEVSDAMAITKEVDGMLLVVRQNYCSRVALADTLEQFEFINAKILGVVFNCTSSRSGSYGKGYYKRNARYYYYRTKDANDKG